MNNKLALIVAVVLGILSIVGINMYIQKIKQDSIRGEELVDVYVASKRVAAGSVIEESFVAVKQIPSKFVRSLRGSQIKKREAIVNSTALIDIEENQIIQSYHVDADFKVGQGLDFKSTYRAITIKVDAVSGIAGMLRPGDWVDVIGCFELQGFGVGGVKIPQITSVLMRQIKVLATDQQTDPNSKSAQFAYRTVTLRVNPEQVTKVAHAQMFGKIFLAKVQDSALKDRNSYPMTADRLLKESEQELQKYQKQK
ncbi:MAG: Flp pilus assembly protein CpaB [Planctomycetota bacterium]|nr:Flp pilus assembly protein CpaB [Planctomycetota bacterium]